MDSVRPTVVVFPLVPVMVSQSAVLRPFRSRTRQASSTSPQTGMWARAAAASRDWSGRHPGDVTIRSGFWPSIFGTDSHGFLAQQDICRPDDPERVGLGQCLGAGGGVNDNHPGAEFDQGVGGREAGDADAGDHYPEPGPVGIPADQVLEPRRAGERGGNRTGHRSTTHSA